jgi:hypothetical protein
MTSEQWLAKNQRNGASSFFDRNVTTKRINPFSLPPNQTLLHTAAAPIARACEQVQAISVDAATAIFDPQ